MRITYPTIKQQPGHKIYPYLLKGLSINNINQVWSSDITYIPMKSGFLYLVVRQLANIVVLYYHGNSPIVLSQISV